MNNNKILIIESKSPPGGRYQLQPLLATNNNLCDVGIKLHRETGRRQLWNIKRLTGAIFLKMPCRRIHRLVATLKM